MAILFGTNKRFDLTRIPFSTDGSMLCIHQSVDDKAMYLSIARCDEVVQTRSKLIRFTPVYEGAELPFTYYCDEATLTLETKHGAAELTFDGADILRIRVRGIGLRFFIRPMMHEGGFERRPGEIEVAYNFIGKLLFKSVSGALRHNASWDFRKVCPFPFDIDILPGSDGIGEAALHEYFSNGDTLQHYAPFDEVRARGLAAFEAFFSNYPPAAPVFRDMARLAAWTVWTTRVGPKGIIQKPLINMHKLFFVRAFGWQQCFHAVALKQNTRAAWELMTSFFEHQNEKGGIPDSLSDLGQQTWLSSKPPIFGFATLHILDHFDLSPLNSADFEDWYQKLSKYADWWNIYHDHSKSGFPAYYHVDESGYDEATLFNRGLPLQAPDLLAYMVLLCEALSRLAELLGKTAEAAQWLSESKRTLDYLVGTLWDGEQFRAKVLSTGELYKCGSVAQLQPVMLGKRLPEKILRKLAQRLTDESEFLTDFGVASENLKSEKYTLRSFTRGPVVAPAEALLIAGLFEGGEREAAEKIAARYVAALMSEGLALGITCYRTEPVSGNAVARDLSPSSVGFPFTPWTASIFLYLTGQVL
jgi:hypothetical protein